MSSSISAAIDVVDEANDAISAIDIRYRMSIAEMASLASSTTSIAALILELIRR